MSKRIESSGIAVTIEDILEEYADQIVLTTDEALDAAQKVLIDNLKAQSPQDSGDYAKSWKSKGKKYKLRRYIGNTKMVKGKGGNELPLSNVLEYADKSPHKGHVKRIYEASYNDMMRAAEKKIEEGV